MKQSELTKWLFDELTQVLMETPNTGITSLSEAADNVDIAEGSDDGPYPFIGVQPIATSPQSAGIGNYQTYVDEKTYVNGVLDSVTLRRESRVRYNFIPTTDDNPKLRDDLKDAIVDYFAVKMRNDEFPEDLDPKVIGETTPSDRPTEFVNSNAIPFVTVYKRYITDNDPDVAEEVNLDVDVSGSVDGMIDDNDTDGDAFDEMFD